MGKLFQELKRRNVFKVGAAYLILGWLLIEITDTVFPQFEFPLWTNQFVTLLVILGFPVALVLAWAFDLTPAGVERTRASSIEDQDAQEEDLQAEAGAKKSILVMPFTNMSPDPGDEYFSDGLTEETITSLSYIASLRVISRSSAMSLKGTQKDLKTLGRELDVEYILEGSVRKAQDDLRITARLIDALTDEHLWKDRYSGSMKDVFDIQEKVARAIVDALRLELGAREDARLSDRPIDNIPAYECYLRARQDTLMFTEEALDRAVRSLRRGLEIIGDNAALYAGLGYAYLQYVNIGLQQDEYIEAAMEQAQLALDLDSESADAHLVLGFAKVSFLGQVEEGLGHLRRVLAVNPVDAHALLWSTLAYLLQGKMQDAYQLVGRLQQADPLTPVSNWVHIYAEMMGGKLDFQVDEIMEWVRAEPENPAAVMLTSFTLLYAGHREEAHAFLQDNAFEGNNAMVKLGLFVSLALDENREQINELLTDDFVTTARRDGQFGYLAGSLFAVTGMYEEALDWIDNAHTRGFINYPFISEYDPLLAGLRETPEFQELLAQVKVKWESLLNPDP